VRSHLIRARGARSPGRPLRQGRLPRPKIPTNISRAYGKAITEKIVSRLPGVVRGVILPHIKLILSAGPHYQPHHADGDYRAILRTTIESARSEFTRRVPKTEGIGIATQAMGAVNVQQAQEAQALAARLSWRTRAREALGVDPFRSEPWLDGVMRDAVSANVELITTIPEGYFDNLETAIRGHVMAGGRASDLADLIRDRFLSDDSLEIEKADRRAALIARDQTNKFFGSLTRARQEDLGITEYVWRTSRDERVRPEHRARDGMTIAWDDPPEDGHPGMPINCRCVAEPVIPDGEEDPEQDQ